MLNFPEKTLRNIALHKTAIYTKFALNNADKVAFDSDISRMNIVAEFSKNTLSIDDGENIKSIFIVKVHLKNKAFKQKNILLLNKLIDQNIVFVLECEGYVCMAVYNTKLHISKWQKIETLELSIIGFNLDTIWQNIITQIGNFEIEEGNSLEAQIEINEKRSKLQSQIEKLEKQARAEKQPRRKLNLVSQIKQLKEMLISKY